VLDPGLEHEIALDDVPLQELLEFWPEHLEYPVGEVDRSIAGILRDGQMVRCFELDFDVSEVASHY
jgi:hypothetical protein